MCVAGLLLLPLCGGGFTRVVLLVLVSLLLFVSAVFAFVVEKYLAAALQKEFGQNRKFLEATLDVPRSRAASGVDGL